MSKFSEKSTPRFPHIHRIEETDRSIINGQTVVSFAGACDWSILTCFTFAPSGYARLTETFTCVEDESKQLNLDVNIIGETPAEYLAEHIRCINGAIIVYETQPIKEFWWNPETRESFADFCAENEIPNEYTDEDIDGDGYIVIGQYTKPDVDWIE